MNGPSKPNYLPWLKGSFNFCLLEPRDKGKRMKSLNLLSRIQNLAGLERGIGMILTIGHLKGLYFICIGNLNYIVIKVYLIGNGC